MIGDEKDQVRKEDELNRQVLTDPVPFPRLLDWVVCNLAQGHLGLNLAWRRFLEMKCYWNTATPIARVACTALTL